MKKKRSPRSWRSAFCRLGSKQNFFHICSVPVQEELVNQFLKKWWWLKNRPFNYFFCQNNISLAPCFKILHTFPCSCCAGSVLAFAPLSPQATSVETFSKWQELQNLHQKQQKPKSHTIRMCSCLTRENRVLDAMSSDVKFSWRSVFACFCACSVTSVVPACWASAA